VQLTFLGTGDARQVPVYGCHCRACRRAQLHPSLRRSACSVCIEHDGTTFLIDAGQRQLPERYPPGSLDAILLTHYHMDHVAGLFELRWGCNTRIPVHGPDDPQGCDDLYKHPGILDFRPPLQAFKPFELGTLRVHPVPLNHSRPTLGYCVESATTRLAYLTDTIGLPHDTRDYLKGLALDLLILDCTHAPFTAQGDPGLERKARTVNHNDWVHAEAVCRSLQPRSTLLTHIGHAMDEWLLDNALPAGIFVAGDNVELTL
jgi:phosphoribosyl 1,2-cyclic phosphate phosphodiesterase